jgi:endonuclease/exonuclease/phosphatase family metal-dependent hydrolase
MSATPTYTVASATVPASAWNKASLFGKREWRPLAKSIAFADASAACPSTLSVATYNVWFDNMVNDIRYPAIAKLVAATDADIVCLQEVNQNFLGHLKADTTVRAAYACLGIEGETIRGGAFHGCLMLVNRKTLTVTQGALTDLPYTRDQRRLLSTRVSGVAGKHTQGIRDVTVATAHLESTGADYATSARRAQLQFIKQNLPASGAIFCADTNLVTEGEARVPEELGFRDAWTGSGNPAHTPTSDALYKSMHTPRRLDRVLYTGNALSATAASLFGETPLKITYPIQMDLYLSDHKGVLAELKL